MAFGQVDALVSFSHFSDACTDMRPTPIWSSVQRQFGFCQGPKGSIYYSLITMCVCIQHNRCYTWTEKRKRGEKEWGAFSFPILNSPVHHQIFKSNKMRNSLSCLLLFLLVMLPLPLLPCLQLVGTLKATLALVAVARKIKGRNFENMSVSALI